MGSLSPQLQTFSPQDIGHLSLPREGRPLSGRNSPVLIHSQGDAWTHLVGPTLSPDQPAAVLSSGLIPPQSFQQSHSAGSLRPSGQTFRNPALQNDSTEDASLYSLLLNFSPANCRPFTGHSDNSRRPGCLGREMCSRCRRNKQGRRVGKDHFSR